MFNVVEILATRWAVCCCFYLCCVVFGEVIIYFFSVQPQCCPMRFQANIAFGIVEDSRNPLNIYSTLGFVEDLVCCTPPNNCDSRWTGFQILCSRVVMCLVSVSHSVLCGIGHWVFIKQVGNMSVCCFQIFLFVGSGPPNLFSDFSFFWKFRFDSLLSLELAIPS